MTSHLPTAVRFGVSHISICPTDDGLWRTMLWRDAKEGPLVASDRLTRDGAVSDARLLHNATFMSVLDLPPPPRDVVRIPAPAPSASRTVRYEAGWSIDTRDGQRGYLGFLRRFSGEWRSYRETATWWEALETALRFADVTPDCQYIGGPHDLPA